MEYMPWWMGSLALAGLTVGFWMLLRRPLGVSGSWSAVVHWREMRARRNAERAMRSADAASVNDALMAATIAQFGATAAQQVLSGAGSPAAPAARPGSRASTLIPWTAHLAFLLALFAGGLFIAFVNGGFVLRWDLGEVHTRLFGTGLTNHLALLLGGLAVGFGTQMSGGCTSGHGLSGCGRLVPASLTATAFFFGTAVATSFALEALAR
jgi:uncharacterized membrane protein YedE/YeeE